MDPRHVYKSGTGIIVDAVKDHAPTYAASVAADVLACNARGDRVALTSVCSAHPLVIRSALEAARDAGQLPLIEATCNQVNQDGGYTGMRPAEFARLVRDAAEAAGTPVLLGGDHLGPQPWRELGSEAAMAKAEALVAAYAAAGFQKLHLDCSMPCADDPAALDEATVAERAGRLMRAAEATGARPIYVIGTEVPAPGGMGEGHAIRPTDPARVALTWEAHRAAMHGTGDAFDRVRAIVVQPGLDFGNLDVVRYDPTAAPGLTAVAADLGGAVYEAHSTDFQPAASYPALVAARFGILKVGPALTFALREALYAAELVEQELVAPGPRAGLRSAIDAAMDADPSHWRSHYPAGDTILRHFALSDRVRYYWAVPAVIEAVRRLGANLDGRDIPAPLLHQYMPDFTPEGPFSLTATATAAVHRALAPYHAASLPHSA